MSLRHLFQATAVVFAAILAAACAAARPYAPDPDAPPELGPLTLRERPVVPPGLAPALAEARRLAGLGRRGDATAALTPALDRHPGFLEGERLLQDLVAGTRGDAWIKRRGEERQDRSPGDADAAYLRARIESSRGAQSDLFALALRIDPGHPHARVGRAMTLERSGEPERAHAELWRAAMEAPWLALPWLHLGGAAFARGAPESAERFFREAAERGPDDPRPWIAMAACADETGRPADAARAALEALRRSPGDPAVLWPLARLLERAGTADDWVEALRIVEPARSDGGDPATVESFRARLLVALGRWDEAEAACVAARAGGASAGDVAVPMRRARAGSGRYADAVEGWLADLPVPAGAAGDDRAPAWCELREAAAAGAATSGDALRLATALESVGWLHEASCVLRTAEARWPGAEGLAERAADLRRFVSFLEDLGREARAIRLAERRGDVTTLGAAMDTVRRMSLDRLGTDVLEGARVQTFPFLGAFTASAESDGPFRDAFGRRGLMLVVGARSGLGANFVLGRLVSRRAAVRAVSGSVPVEYDEHWIETEGLPEGLVGRHGGVAGLTIGRFVLLQLDVVRRGPAREDAALPFLARPATHDSALRALDTPSEVAQRIERRLASEGVLESAAFDAVVCHERVHVRDAARLLPLWSHPFAALALAWESGFSAARIEQSLEARAAVGALADAAEPRAALAALLAFLPAEDGETAHVAGYRRVVARAVDIVVSDPAAFPTIDPRFNVVQQLDRLTPSQIRELARRLGDSPR